MIVEGKKCKVIPGFSNYCICEDGSVYSLRGKIPLLRKPQLGTNGYYELSLSRGEGVFHRKSIHRLLALAYIPIDSDTSFLVVNHKNGNKLDNRIENLEWVTHKENIEHAGKLKLTTKCLPVSVIVKSSLEITNYPSINECARALGYTKDTVKWRVTVQGLLPYKDGLYFVKTDNVEGFLHKITGVNTESVKESGKKPVLLKDLVSGSILNFTSISDLAFYLERPLTTVSVWLKTPNQPVLPGLVQIKFADDTSEWRQVTDVYKELSLFTRTKVILVKNKNGDSKIFSSAVECAKWADITPTCLAYRLKSKGTKLFSDNYYMYYEDTKVRLPSNS